MHCFSLAYKTVSGVNGPLVILDNVKVIRNMFKWYVNLRGVVLEPLPFNPPTEQSNLNLCALPHYPAKLEEWYNIAD